jgi:hypothetical protein
MQRRVLPENPRLEALLHDRDHIRIRISLLLDGRPPDKAKIEELYRQLGDLERRIAATPPPS